MSTPFASFSLTPAQAAFCETLDAERQAALDFLVRHQHFLVESGVHNRFYDSDRIELPDTAAKKITETFLRIVLEKITQWYGFTVDLYDFPHPLPDPLTLEIILEEVARQLGGEAVSDRVLREIRNAFRAMGPRRKDLAPTVQGATLRLPSWVYFRETSWSNPKTYYLDREDFLRLARTLAHFAYGDPAMVGSFSHAYMPSYSPADCWFRRFDFPTSKVQALRWYKNGRVDLTLADAATAQQFVATYLPD